MKCALFIDEEAWYIEPLLIYFEARYPHCKHHHSFNGVEALNYVKNTKVDCIVLDIMMPYGDESVTERFAGLIILDEIRRLSQDVPIICYTARNEDLIKRTIDTYSNVQLFSKNESVEKFWHGVDKYLK